MRKIVVALILVSTGAITEDFSSRVAAGNAAIATPEGKTYDTSLAPAIQSAMLACAPPGLQPKEAAGKFSLVGYADASGHLSEVAVAPVTRVSSCFADKFGASQLPAPPSSGRWGDSYPVTVEMSVTP